MSDEAGNSEIIIENEELADLIGIEKFDFPKYSTQLLNLANRNAQGTRPEIVGQMSELIKEFPGKSIDEWEEWYTGLNPTSLDDAVDKIYPMLKKFQKVIGTIDKAMVKNWVKDLVINKSYTGLLFQEAILKKVSQIENTSYQLATPEEESKGIDGYIGNTPVSIKPTTYKHMEGSISENISVRMVYYEKQNDRLVVFV